MKLVLAMIKPAKLDDVKDALSEIGVEGMSVTEIKGYGRTKGKSEVYRGSAYIIDFAPKLRLEIVMDDGLVEQALTVLEQTAKTGRIGDGKVFVLPVDEALRIRTGERGLDAL